MAATEVQSNVSIITSDFAMQNVILQMGLRLLTPDGVRIDSLQRFALRCEACFFISLSSAKAFCSRCGNGGTMKKVTMQVDSNGVMQFGVRKRHNIRGTRYSLPMPKSATRLPLHLFDACRND
jgi:RNA-binding protein NOB1